MLKSLLSLNKTSTKIKASKAKTVHEKLQQFVKDGSENLGVITDFDFTLSRYRCRDGSKGILVHELFLENENDPLMSLAKKYAPIEHNRGLTTEQKAPHMMQWWKESNSIMALRGYDKLKLEKLLDDSKSLQLRDGFEEFFRVILRNDIPSMIFSAGIADIIEIILRRSFLDFAKNVQIISNRMKYDEKGKVIAFADPIIHTSNKNCSLLLTIENDNDDYTKFLEQIRQRRNLLLIGDALYDAQMATGLKIAESESNKGDILKIGYLNHSVGALVEQYMETFDIVCVEDHTLDVPIDVLKAVADEKQDSS